MYTYLLSSCDLAFFILLFQLRESMTQAISTIKFREFSLMITMSPSLRKSETHNCSLGHRSTQSVLSQYRWYYHYCYAIQCLYFNCTYDCVLFMVADSDMVDFCEDVLTWMEGNVENVIVVHCKGGKGEPHPPVAMAAMILSQTDRKLEEVPIIMWFHTSEDHSALCYLTISVLN